MIRTGIVVLLLCAPILRGEDTPPQALAAPSAPLSLKEAVQLAGENYPAIRASLAEVSAAESGVDLARTAYLPKTDLYYQTNRATRNNVFGMLLPNGVLPSISGPASEDATATSTWGSAAGLLFSWEPFDLGLRKANVEVARALQAKAKAGVVVTSYEISLAVTQAYFAAVAAKQAMKAAQANVDRLQVFADAVGVLVRSQLRPGADESRARAELARAQTEFIMAERAEKQARVSLARWLGLGGQKVEVNGAPLLREPPTADAGPNQLEQHPFAAVQSAAIDVVRARQESLAKAYRPKFEVLSSVYGRGTGANLDGTFQGGANGLAPSTGNWAVGMGVRFPVFDYKQNQVRREIESHNERREAARLDEVIEQLKSEVEAARVQVEAARKIAATTPEGLDAAQTLDTQAQARYRAGLGTVIEVAEAQRLLRQAETDDALARLGVWQALFAVAAAEGDMTGLLEASDRQ